MSESKSQVLKILNTIPDEMSEMEIVERLYMLTRLEHSIERCEKEGVYSDEEVTAHFQNRRVELPA